MDTRRPSSTWRGSADLRAIALLVALASAAFAPAGCYRPGAVDCVVACGAGDACPKDMTCSNGYCTTSRRSCVAVTAPPACEVCIGGADQHSRCRGDVVLRCNPPLWVEESRCSDQQVCYQGGCVDCRPGQWRCREGCQEACNTDGRWAGFDVCTSCPQTSAAPPAPQLALGWSHTCALLPSAAVKCWGDASYGQLGLDDPAALGDPVELGGQPGDMARLPTVDLGRSRPIVQLVAGGRHTCALFDDGIVKCWGDNSHGQLGLGDVIDRGDATGQMGSALPAIDFGPDRYAVKLAAGGRHTCALLDDGSLKCWGANDAGQLGLGDREDRGDQPCEMGVFLAPVDLDVAPVIDLSAGDAFTCALAGGQVRCWGDGEHGELGSGDVGDDRLTPAALDAPAFSSTVVALTAGFGHACALQADEHAVCWGANSAGQLGIDANSSTKPGMDGHWPSVKLSAGLIAIVAGGSHTCALDGAGAVRCWGLNTAGQLGLGSAGNRGDEPAEIEMLPTLDLGGLGAARATALFAGGDHTCAVLDDDGVKCWGANDSGQLGIDSLDDRGRATGQMGDDLPVLSL